MDVKKDEEKRCSETAPKTSDDFPAVFKCCYDCATKDYCNYTRFVQCGYDESFKYFQPRKPRAYRRCDDKGNWGLDIDSLRELGLSYGLASFLSTVCWLLTRDKQLRYARFVIHIADLVVDDLELARKAPRDDA